MPGWLPIWIDGSFWGSIAQHIATNPDYNGRPKGITIGPPRYKSILATRTLHVLYTQDTTPPQPTRKRNPERISRRIKDSSIQGRNRNDCYIRMRGLNISACNPLVYDIIPPNPDILAGAQCLTSQHSKRVSICSCLCITAQFNGVGLGGSY